MNSRKVNSDVLSVLDNESLDSFVSTLDNLLKQLVFLYGKDIYLYDEYFYIQQLHTTSLIESCARLLKK